MLQKMLKREAAEEDAWEYERVVGGQGVRRLAGAVMRAAVVEGDWRWFTQPRAGSTLAFWCDILGLIENEVRSLARTNRDGMQAALGTTGTARRKPGTGSGVGPRSGSTPGARKAHAARSPATVKPCHSNTSSVGSST